MSKEYKKPMQSLIDIFLLRYCPLSDFYNAIIPTIVREYLYISFSNLLWYMLATFVLIGITILYARCR